MNAPKDNSRRDFLKKTAYVVPLIMTMSVAPSLASAGSPRRPHNGGNDGKGMESRSRERGRRPRHGFLHKLKSSIRKAFW